ncbi:MAG: hypothetical protein ACLPSO_00040, partial [Terracidiphilus sp.]
RMLLRLRERGDRSLVHGLRGRPSNRKLPARLEQKILARLQQRYAEQCRESHSQGTKSRRSWSGSPARDQSRNNKSLEWLLTGEE